MLIQLKLLQKTKNMQEEILSAFALGQIQGHTFELKITVLIFVPFCFKYTEIILKILCGFFSK